MSMILVVEPDRSFAEQLADALKAAGWATEVVGDRTAAIARMSERQPAVVFVDIVVPEAEELLAACAAGRGGPGSIAVIPAPLAGEVSADDYQADAIVTKPFSDEQLTRAIEACSLMRRQRRPDDGGAKRPSQHLSSADIFGDIVAEVESAARAEAKAAAVPARRAKPSIDDDLEERLQQTLSGVMDARNQQLRAPAPAAKVESEDDGVDDLLDRTLGSLVQVRRPAKPSPATASAAQPVAAPVAPAPSAPPASAHQPSAPAPIAHQPAAHQPSPATPAASEPAGNERGLPVSSAHPPSTPAPGPPVPTVSEPLAPEGGVAATEAEQPATVESRLATSEAAPVDQPADVLAAIDVVDAPRVEATAPEQAAGEPVPAQPPDPPSGPFLRPPPPLEMPVSLDPPASLDAPVSADAPALADAMASADPSASADLAAAAEEAPSDEPADPYRTQLMPTVSAAGGEQEEAFGDYTLLERIAVGGMAEVWKARRRGVEGFEKTVAIKRVLAHLTDSPELVSMLIDEAKLAARLSHPNIVQIYDLGKVDDDFFIAMELVSGTDLRSVLKRSRRNDLPIPIGVALGVAARLARALDYAHRLKDDDHRELGLIHRDISPQNVLISGEGDIKLCDFGIAKAVTSAGHTQMGALKGKLQYMSPEQAWGKKLDARSDLFSLGTVLFEMLTGTKLFTGDSEIGVLDAVRDCRVQSPRAIDPDIPEEAERIVLRALGKAPEDRYQSAGALAGDLEALLASLPQPSGASDLATYLGQLDEADGDRPADDGEARAAAAGTPSAAAVARGTGSAVTGSAVTGSAVTGTGSAVTGTGSAVTGTGEPAFQAVADQASMKGRGRWWLVAAILAAIVLVSVWLAIVRQPADGSATVAPDSAPLATAPADGEADAATPGDTAGGTPGATTAGDADGAQDAQTAAPAEEESTVDLEQLVADELAKRAAALEAKMRAEYAQEQRRLAEQLAEAQARAAAAEEDPSGDDAGDGNEGEEPVEEGGGG